jgi:myo-inositol-1(or 4)-monophosphatase
MERKDVALQAVTTASLFLQEQYQKGHIGTEKSDGSLVSEADHGSDKIIIDTLQKSFPEDGLLSEEREEISGTSGYRWILDPLDGTHNFLCGIPLFGILLALEKEGEVILSFCVFPVLQETFIAEKGKGAFCNGVPIRVSSLKSLKGAMFLSDSNSRLEVDTIIGDLRPFLSSGCKFRFLGAGAFGMTRVALGSAHAALTRSEKVWDFAAPALLVEEAGGTVTDLTGKQWNVQSRSLLATNGSFHSEALGLLAR